VPVVCEYHVGPQVLELLRSRVGEDVVVSLRGPRADPTGCFYRSAEASAAAGRHTLVCDKPGVAAVVWRRMR